MKRAKKIASVMLTVVLCMSLSMVAFASEKSKDKLPGYTKLTGNISTSTSSGCKVSTNTWVTTNPDSAYLRVKIELQCMYGTTLKTDSASSSTGATTFPKTFTVVHFDDVNTVFGSHNVQGGKTHPAQVVYTYTHP